MNKYIHIYTMTQETILSDIGQLSTTLFNIKEKITDNEYLSIMNNFGNIYNNVTNFITRNVECKCNLDSEEFCNISIKKFISCNNLQYILCKFPLLRNIVLLYAMTPEMKLSNPYKLMSYVTNDILDTKQQVSNYFISFVNFIQNLNVNIGENIEYQFIVIVTLYEYVYKNISSSAIKSQTVYELYNKLQLFIEQNKLFSNNLKNLYEMLCFKEADPFETIHKYMLPHYHKRLMNEEFIKIHGCNVKVDDLESDLEDNLEEEYNNIEHRFRMIEEQATEEIINEFRYPLRNRISARMHQLRNDI